jgi:hemin uptake protein HemP
MSKTNEPEREADRETGASVRVVSASELLGSARTLQIEHKGAVYTLRLTRNDRLILTK